MYPHGASRCWRPSRPERHSSASAVPSARHPMRCMRAGGVCSTLTAFLHAWVLRACVLPGAGTSPCRILRLCSWMTPGTVLGRCRPVLTAHLGGAGCVCHSCLLSLGGDALRACAP
eukprot:364001-Chlamydomonas_euryale.AAC.3